MNHNATKQAVSAQSATDKGNDTYTIKSDTPAINRTFDTKEQAQMFAEQIKLDYPTAVIECVKNGGV